ncbi:hypothetical protein I4U23_004359 [Adineta vaga]|nr:hypothetical protein I4U23_004359 [Adineta vaga]
MENSRRVKSADYSAKIQQLNRDIRECRQGALFMAQKEQERGYRINETDSKNVEKIRIRMIRLRVVRHDDMIRSYSGAVVKREIPKIPEFPNIGMVLEEESHKPTKKNSSPPKHVRTQSKHKSANNRPSSPPPVLKVAAVVLDKNRAIIDMKIEEKQSNDRIDDNKNNNNNNDSDIVYPAGVKDHHPYKIVAQYRRLLGKSTDFNAEPLCIGEDETETTILGLSNFAGQHGCDLIFTDEEHRFDNSMYRAACGVADLGSIHLLATDAVQTATFCFVMDFDFNNEFEESTERVESFVTDFCQAIATILVCDANNIRMFSISKMDKDKKKSEVKFGVTTAEVSKTEQLAEKLKSRARSGFSGNKVLERVVARNYDYTWKPALQALRLQISDLAPQFNFDYRPDYVPSEDNRGGHVYFLPRGWYRHGLRVLHKYEKDSIWLESTNAKGVWPVAFHGTKSWAVLDIAQHGLKTSAVKVDAMRQDAIEQMGNEADGPGLYVATHCDGGANIYTEPFTVTSSSNQTESFRIVFQCRVKPEKFTIHESPVNNGKAWRYVDPSCIRPYGILLKKEN